LLFFINNIPINTVDELDMYFSQRKLIERKLIEEIFDLDGNVGLSNSEICPKFKDF